MNRTGSAGVLAGESGPYSILPARRQRSQVDGLDARCSNLRGSPGGEARNRDTPSGIHPDYLGLAAFNVSPEGHLAP